MVIFFTGFLVLIALQFLFLRNGLRKGARGDKNFVVIQLISIGIVISYGINILFLHFGEKGLWLSKMMLSIFGSLFMIELGVFTKVKIENFAQKTKYTNLVVFIVSLIVTFACSISFFNIQSELFFSYEVTKWLPFSAFSENIVVFVPGDLWMTYAFFWCALVFIYGLLDITRIVMRSLINSIHEVIIIVVFIIESILFITFVKKPEIFCFQLGVFTVLLPIFYFCLMYRDKPLFIKRSLRSSLFDQTNEMYVIFNADDLLVDFNGTAKEFFGFTNNDVLKLNIKKFISDYVPLGSVPSDSFSIEQIYVKGKNEERRICQLDYRRISYFRNVTRCSFFALHDISELLKSFTDLQQASMTDNITGLLAQHVLTKKIREINMYRKFPYSVAACSVQIKNSSSRTINNNIALIHVSECIRSKIRGSDFASYENGKIILLFPATLEVAQSVMDRIAESINDDELMEFDINFSYGLATRETPDTDIQETINKAHSLMFQKNVEIMNK